MKTYTLYFEFFGRKMKTTVEANSEAEAKIAVTNRIKFDKVESSAAEKSVTEDELDHLSKVLGVDNPFKGMFSKKNK